MARIAIYDGWTVRAATEGAATRDDAGRLTIAPVSALPERLAVGRGTALFVDGACSHPSRSIRRLSVFAGEQEHPALGWEMPPPGSLSGGEYWWAILPIEAIESR